MFAKLLLERMIRAGIASAAAYLAVGISSVQISNAGLKALGVGVAGALVSGFMSTLSTFFGDPNSTSFTQAAVTGPEAGGK